MNGVGIGDIVLYTLDSDDVTTIAALRAQRDGSVTWNPVLPGQTYPAQVVGISPVGALNLQVALDGSDVYWKQFATKATGPMEGMWSEKPEWKPL